MKLPIYICTNCGPASFKNTASVSRAQARASRVFPSLADREIDDECTYNYSHKRNN